MQEKGFTLIELLIVIGIISVLAAATLVVLNPAEMLRKARDSQRIQDIDSLGSALGLYLAEISNPTTGTVLGTCAASGGWCSDGTTGSGPCGSYGTTSRDVDGTGWVPIDFTQLSSGAPFSALPVDPRNTGNYHYVFDCTESNGMIDTYELNAKFESNYYNSTTTGFVTKDGGNDNDTYEKGNDPGLDIIGDW